MRKIATKRHALEMILLQRLFITSFVEMTFAILFTTLFERKEMRKEMTLDVERSKRI